MSKGFSFIIFELNFSKKIEDFLVISHLSQSIIKSIIKIIIQEKKTINSAFCGISVNHMCTSLSKLIIVIKITIFFINFNIANPIF